MKYTKKMIIKKINNVLIERRRKSNESNNII